MQAIFVLGSIGLLLSCYSLFVRYQFARNKQYRPLCDIRENVSCTKAFMSEYGKLGILPNAMYGIVFYLALLILWFVGQSFAVLALSSFAVLGSVYLAYISFVRMKNYCLVCCAVYVVNLLLLFFSMYWYFLYV